MLLAVSSESPIMISKLFGVYREVGAAGLGWRLFSYFYKNFIRPALPNSSQILYAGIPIGHRKVGDQVLPKLYNSPDVSDAPSYEQALVTALKAHVASGDEVVIVGGGLGVTSVIAALAAAETGHVKCFEGDLHGVDAVRRVARLNGVLEHITAYYAVVGQAIGVYGRAVATKIVHPSELPSCDFLELDCEGAEIGILRDMTIQPRTIAVETHGFLGAPTGAVRELLESRGYRVQDLGWAEPRFLNACVENDIRVLVGTLAHQTV
jgi:Methyltransferase FkbM domain